MELAAQQARDEPSDQDAQAAALPAQAEPCRDSWAQREQSAARLAEPRPEPAARCGAATRGGCDTTTVDVTVACDKIKIYNGFSPNGDGNNDVFVIEGIEKYQNNTVTVYNRWGNQVMLTKGYKNDWNGKWNGVDLPDGTYFYVFEDGEGNKTTGYVQIQR